MLTTVGWKVQARKCWKHIFEITVCRKEAKKSIREYGPVRHYWLNINIFQWNQGYSVSTSKEGGWKQIKSPKKDRSLGGLFGPIVISKMCFQNFRAWNPLPSEACCRCQAFLWWMERASPNNICLILLAQNACSF